MGIHIENIYGDVLAWICVYTNTSQVSPTIEVGVPISLVRNTGLTIQESKNMSLDTSDGKITTTNAGLYLCQVHCAFSGATNDNMKMQWVIGGVATNPATITWTQKGGNKWEVSSGLLIQIDADQEIDLQIQNDTNPANITLLNFTQTIIKLY